MPPATRRAGGTASLRAAQAKTSGVPAEELVPVRKVLYAFVSGFLSAESSGVLAELSGESDPDDTFEAAVDLIVAGLESRRPSPMTPG